MSSKIYLDFKEKFLRLKHRNIILYGLNNISQSILRNNKNFKLLGVEYDETIEIKKIKKIKIKNNLKYNPIIIITTKNESAKIIFLELKSRFENKIEIFFLDGSKELAKINQINLNYNRLNLEKLEKVILKYDIVSFDLFDTLINRNCSKPRDIIHFLGKDKHVKQIKKFSELRLVTQSNLEKSGKSFNIKEIYNILNKKLKLSKKKINQLIQNEINFEKKFSTINNGIKKIYELCKINKKIIYITSDFHFPKKDLKDILNLHKITGYKEIISSCDYGYFKSGGKLFKILKKKNKSKNIIHIGDNIKADINASKNESIKPFRIYSPREIVMNSNIRDIFGNIKNDNDKICVGLIQNKLQSYTENNLKMTNNYKSFKISLEDFGYIFLGNIIFEYLEWVNKEAENKKIPNIFFASREGYFLSKIYKKNFEVKNTNILYLRSSRFIADNISYKKTSDIYNSFKNHRYHGTFKNLLLHRFNVKINKNDKNKNLEINTKIDLKILPKFLKNYETIILNNSKNWREKYTRYLAKSKKINNKIAICDISLFATLQNSLSKITSNDYYGFYIPTQANYKETKKIKFMKLDEKFEKSFFILESILTAPHGSFLYLEKNTKFIYQKKMSNQKFFNNRKIIIKGVEKYIRTMKMLKNENNIYSKKDFEFGTVNGYLFSQIKNKIFNFDKRLFQSLYFDNMYVRIDENKINI